MKTLKGIIEGIAGGVSFGRTPTIRLTRYTRIHIPVDFVTLLFVLAALVIMPKAHAIERHLVSLPNATAAAQPVQKLVIASGAGYKTNIKINADTDSAVVLDACQQGGIMYIKAHGSRYLEDAGSFLCPGPAYRLIDAPASVRSYTDYSYSVGSVKTSFNFDPIGAVTPSAPSTIGQREALVNTGARVAYVLCGFKDWEGTLAVDVYGPDAQALGSETVQCNPSSNGTPTLQPLATKFQSGFVVVRNVSAGYPGFGQTIYGAIVNSAPDNSNARVYAFGQ